MTAHAELQASQSTVADLLAEARKRTLLLVSPLTEDELRMQHDILMSPVIWDPGTSLILKMSGWSRMSIRGEAVPRA